MINLRRKIFALTTILIASLFSAPPLSAAENNDTPIEITAQNSLEWHRSDKRFTANGLANAMQGETSISANTLVALYTESDDTNFDIHTLKANENVVISTRDSQAYGDFAIYDVKAEKATMTGNNLQIISKDQTLEARDKFEYYVAKGELIAHGDALITRPKLNGQFDTIRADKVKALFINNEKGERVLKNVEAFENLIIKTPTETITGQYGIYHANTNKAELKGGVKILRGPNTLEGNRAEVDLTTNVSTLFGNTKSKTPKRVRGVFYPGSEEKGQ